MKKLILLSSVLFSSIILAQSEQELKKIAEKNTQEYQKNLERVLREFPTISMEKAKTIVGFTSDGMPLFNEIDNVESAKATNSDIVANTTINGENVTLSGSGVEVYVWDENQIRSTHQEFGGRVTVIESTSNSNHATHVAGTILASGVTTTAKGIAPAATIKGYSFDNSMGTIPGATDAHLSNHSYGVPQSWSYRNSSPNGNDMGAGWYFLSNYSASSTEVSNNGYYNNLTYQWDNIAYNAPLHTQIKAAGNNYGSGPSSTSDAAFRWDGSSWVAISGTRPAKDCSTGYDCLNPQSVAKNLIVVAAANQIAINPFTNPQGRYVNPASVVRASFSAVGPRDDGAIKPDVTAIGTNVYSSIATTDSSYDAYQGTSMSSPNVTGVLALIQQLHLAKRGGLMRADMAKAIITHSANEAGSNPGPDAMFGWGIVDALKAATLLVMKDNTVYIADNVLDNGQTYEYTFTAGGSEPVKATISWLDPAATPIAEDSSLNNRTSRLVNDLDVRIVKISDTTTTMPWKLNPDSPSAAATKGDNTVDNVEQVLIDTPTADATYKVVVNHKGTLTNGSSLAPSNYALIVSGIKQGTMASVSDISQDIEKLVSIYPNPVVDELRINSDNLEIKDASIFDATGKMVKYTDDLQNNSINVSHLEKGNYIILIDTVKGTVSRTFIKK